MLAAGKTQIGQVIIYGVDVESNAQLARCPRISMAKHIMGGSTRGVVRGFAHRLYHRLAATNYGYRLYVRRNQTPAGSFRCYEPINRHGRDEMLADLEAACSPTATVVDAGANVGIYALALATASPRRRIVAFEPAPSVAERLRLNVCLNDLNAQIEVHQSALGDSDGECRFYCSTNPELSAFDREAATRWGASVADATSVSVFRLDSVCATGDTVTRPAPDAIKVDVEGAAPAVLRGARNTLEYHEPTVFIEIHEDGIDADVPTEARRLLEDVGYEIDERAGYWRCVPGA